MVNARYIVWHYSDLFPVFPKRFRITYQVRRYDGRHKIIYDGATIDVEEDAGKPEGILIFASIAQQKFVLECRYFMPGQR